MTAPETLSAATQCCGMAAGGSAGPVTPASCAGLRVLSAPVSSVNGQPVLSRMRSFIVKAGQCGAVWQWQLTNQNGQPVDLAGCAGSVAEESLSSSLPIDGGSEGVLLPEDSSLEVSARLRESLGYCCGHAYDLPVSLIDLEDGTIQIHPTAAAVAKPGVYYCEVSLHTVGQPDCAIMSNVFYVIVQRSVFDCTVLGPPSIAEIRLQLRDSSGDESFLLDNIAFDDSEIALSIWRPVAEWNETPPPVACFDTSNFPFRHFWLEAICGNLFLIAAEQYRRNQLSYEAAGVAVDDNNKEPNYERAAKDRLAVYRDWLKRTKVSMNMQQAYGGIGSDYSLALRRGESYSA